MTLTSTKLYSIRHVHPYRSPTSRWVSFALICETNYLELPEIKLQRLDHKRVCFVAGVHTNAATLMKGLHNVHKEDP
jgi:hypothetical protein